MHWQGLLLIIRKTSCTFIACSTKELQQKFMSFAPMVIIFCRIILTVKCLKESLNVLEA